MRVIRTIDHSLYPRGALADAIHAYRDYCEVSALPIAAEKTQLTITVKEACKHEARQVVLEFLNYALDRSAQIHLEEE